MKYLGIWNNTYLIESVDCWRQTTVDAKYLIVDNGGQAEIVENFSAVAPDVHRAILLQAFVIKPVYLGNLARFVIAANEGNAIRVANLKKVRNMKYD